MKKKTSETEQLRFANRVIGQMHQRLRMMEGQNDQLAKETTLDAISLRTLHLTRERLEAEVKEKDDEIAKLKSLVTQAGSRISEEIRINRFKFRDLASRHLMNNSEEDRRRAINADGICVGLEIALGFLRSHGWSGENVAP